MADLILLFIVILTAVAATSVVFFKHTIASALSLLGVLFLLAVIYALVGAHFVAGMQLIVYAGAIMVLFIFSIMLLNLGREETDLSFHKPQAWIAVMTSGILFITFVQVFRGHKPDLQAFEEGPFTPSKIANLGGNVSVLAESLFKDHYLSFELLSVVLLMAVVGAVILAKRRLSS